jgi:hypothetical protein
MGNSRQIFEIQPDELNRIARKATSDGFAKAIKSDITVIYTEGNSLIERMPNGKKIRVKSLNRENRVLNSVFKLK